MGGDRGLGPLTLLCWLSPSFPVGAYAYSHALEWAAESGDVRDAPSLASWIGDILLEGAGRNDCILLGAAHRAAAAGEADALAEVNDLALALAASAEFRLETSQQGRSFLDAVTATWPRPELARLTEPFGRIAYPVAIGLAAAAHGIDRRDAARAFLVAYAGNLVSAALRLAPMGQTAGQRVLAGLVPKLAVEAELSVELDVDAIGSATFRADLASFRHETQYTRLFRS